jgi:hypothetical protein
MQVERSIDQELVPCVRNITPPLIWRGSWDAQKIAHLP